MSSLNRHVFFAYSDPIVDRAVVGRFRCAINRGPHFQWSFSFSIDQPQPHFRWPRSYDLESLRLSDIFAVAPSLRIVSLSQLAIAFHYQRQVVIVLWWVPTNTMATMAQRMMSAGLSSMKTTSSRKMNTISPSLMTSHCFKPQRSSLSII